MFILGCRKNCIHSIKKTNLISYNKRSDFYYFTYLFLIDVLRRLNGSEISLRFMKHAELTEKMYFKYIFFMYLPIKSILGARKYKKVFILYKINY